jgi:hypothetical protein
MADQDNKISKGKLLQSWNKEVIKQGKSVQQIKALDI